MNSLNRSTTVPSTDRNFDLGVIGFGSGLASGTITGGAVSGGGVSGSSFSLTATYSDCGEVKTATITSTCGTNQQITLTSTGGAAFAGTGDVTCFFRPTQTTITSAIDGNGNPVQNGGSTNSRSITFQVTATAGTSPIAAFKCNLDGSAFDTCATTNPATISYPPGIFAAGRHTFEVRAVDTEGNIDLNLATFSWTVVIQPPTQTTITSAIDGNGNPVQNGGSTSSTSITFQFTATPGSNLLAGFECSLDGNLFSTCAAIIPGTVSYKNLVAGQHTFAVRAVDTQGIKDLNPATFSWTVLTPTQATQKLIGTIDSMHLPTGTTTSLEATLNAAINQLNRNNHIPACNQLNAFLNKVNAKQTNGELTPQQAADLTQQAIAIQLAIGCSNIGSSSSPSLLPLPMP